MIETIRKKVAADQYRFTLHALERMVERDIQPDEIKTAISNGKIIEDYPQDKYGHSCLICGHCRPDKILHVQCSVDPVWVITSYDPSNKPEKWDETYTKRRTS